VDLHSTKPAAGWFDRLIDVLAVVAGALICLLVVLICVDVFARNTGTINMPWSLEVAQYSMLVVTFFGAPWVLREQGHIVVDLLLQGLEPARRAKVDRIGHVVCAIVCAVLTYFATLVWWRSYQSGIKIHDTFVFPEWVLMSVAPPTFLILMAQFVRWVAHPPARGASGVEDGL
jgi:TRAP-type C4-dicarboxylate transport system permease small subunit